MPRQGLYVALIAAAVGVASSAQQNRSREFGPRACGPADPTQIRVASETGGQPFFLSPTELAASMHIMRETASADRELILWASASSEGRPLEFPIPVDSSIGRLTISASFDRQGGTLNIIAPDGRVNPRPEGSEETILNCAHVLTIATPSPGIWQAEVTGTGRAWVVASGGPTSESSRRSSSNSADDPDMKGCSEYQGSRWWAGRRCCACVSTRSILRSRSSR